MKLLPSWLRLSIILSSLVFIFTAAAHASSTQTPSTAPKVLASLHPLALVAASVVPTQQLSVLVPVGMSPHDFSLRPSDIRRLQQADVVIWAGAEAEPYLQNFMKRWPEKHWLDISQFQAHSSSQDPHWWLAPRMMIAAQQALADYLELPAGQFAEQIEHYIAQAQQELAPVQERGFWVFHQAYDHFVELMNLKQLGAFTLSPERKPGVRTLQKIRNQLANGEAVCVFSEPEFSPALVDTVLHGQSAQRGELDPLASSIAIHRDGYLHYLQDMTARFKRCLSPVTMGAFFHNQ